MADATGGRGIRRAGDLGLQQQAGRWMDKLDIFFIQRDDTGLHAQVEGQTLGLRSSTTKACSPPGFRSSVLCS